MTRFVLVNSLGGGAALLSAFARGSLGARSRNYQGWDEVDKNLSIVSTSVIFAKALCVQGEWDE